MFIELHFRGELCSFPAVCDGTIPHFLPPETLLTVALSVTQALCVFGVVRWVHRQFRRLAVRGTSGKRLVSSVLHGVTVPFRALARG